MSSNPIGVGVIGLGLGAYLTIPWMAADPRFRLVAGSDPRPEARLAFEGAVGERAYDPPSQMLKDERIELVYVATPHFLHHEHALQAIDAGKHVLVEKPLARTVGEGAEIVDAAARRKVRAFYGHTHAYDLPIREMARIATSGELGRLGAIMTFNYTDMIYRPRALWELTPKTSGGTVLIQAPHQLDIVRAIAASAVTAVMGWSAALDPARPILSMHMAMLEFASGAAASLFFSGKGHFDTARWTGWLGESGDPRNPQTHNVTWRDYDARQDEAEATARNARRIGPRGFPVKPPVGNRNEVFGVTIVSAERGDIRQTPSGLMVETGRRSVNVRLPSTSGRVAMLDEIHAALRADVAPKIDAAWGLETLRLASRLERPVQ